MLYCYEYMYISHQNEFEWYELHLLSLTLDFILVDCHICRVTI